MEGMSASLSKQIDPILELAKVWQLLVNGRGGVLMNSVGYRL